MVALRNLLSLKPGLRTSEFWSHAIVSLLSLLVALGAIPVGLPTRYQTWVQLGAFIAAAVCSGLYALARGHAKAGASSLVQLLDHSVETLLRDGGPDGMNLLHKVLPELDGISPTAGTDLKRLLSAIESHSSQLAELYNWIHQFTTPSYATAGSGTANTASVTDVVMGLDPMSGTAETADGVTDAGPGGWPDDAAAVPVGSVQTPTPAPTAGAPVAASPAAPGATV